MNRHQLGDLEARAFPEPNEFDDPAPTTTKRKRKAGRRSYKDDYEKMAARCRDLETRFRLAMDVMQNAQTDNEAPMRIKIACDILGE